MHVFLTSVICGSMCDGTTLIYITFSNLFRHIDAVQSDVRNVRYLVSKNREKKKKDTLQAPRIGVFWIRFLLRAVSQKLVTYSLLSFVQWQSNFMSSCERNMHVFRHTQHTYIHQYISVEILTIRCKFDSNKSTQVWNWYT